MVSWPFRGKIVLGYTEAELRMRGSGYQFIHAADMMYCAENHIRSKSQLLPLDERLLVQTTGSHFAEVLDDPVSQRKPGHPLHKMCMAVASYYTVIHAIRQRKPAHMFQNIHPRDPTTGNVVNDGVLCSDVPPLNDCWDERSLFLLVFTPDNITAWWESCSRRKSLVFIPVISQNTSQNKVTDLITVNK